jgi:hypothetical protein
MNRAVKDTRHRRMQAARDLADQLAVVVGECTHDQAATWLTNRMLDEQFELTDLVLVLASMVPTDPYFRYVKERFDPPPVVNKR